MKEFNQKLGRVIAELKAPKNQVNKFGGYNYRSCEDILEAVKPLLTKQGLTLRISDEIIAVGERIYIKATAQITDGENSTQTTALAREELTKKGMDAAQITGSASSYARKYALNGLFLIDDSKDPDATNTHGKDFSKSERKFEKPAFKLAESQREELAAKMRFLGFAEEKIAPATAKIKSLDDYKTAIAKLDQAMSNLKEA